VNVVEPGSPAERAGIRPGDQIVSFDGKNNPDWQDVQHTVLVNPGRPLPITIERNGKTLQFTVTPDRKGREEAGDVGMFPVIRTIVQDVQPNSPAARAGVKPGDEIIRVNRMDLRTSGRTLQQTIQQMTEKTFPITVLRAPNPELNPGTTREVDLEVTPEMRDGRRMIGIGIQFPTVHVKLRPVQAFQKSLQSNKENAALIFQVIGRLLRREASLKQLDGPVGIVAVSGQAYQAGFATLLTFMALISLNLGILNILPIPILDGGVILLLIIESLMGRDLSLRMKERIVQASFVFLLMLTVIVIYNDVVKLLPPTQPTP
jgi:regulator of sigma E protease